MGKCLSLDWFVWASAVSLFKTEKGVLLGKDQKSSSKIYPTKRKKKTSGFDRISYWGVQWRWVLRAPLILPLCELHVPLRRKLDKLKEIPLFWCNNYTRAHCSWMTFYLFPVIPTPAPNIYLFNSWGGILNRITLLSLDTHHENFLIIVCEGRYFLSELWSKQSILLSL